MTNNDDLCAPANDIPSLQQGDLREVPNDEAPRIWSRRYSVLRCKTCGGFVGNGGWVPFGKCKKCGESW